LVLLFVEEELGSTLAEQGFFLVAPVPEGYLAFLREDQHVLLRNRGMPHRILDSLVGSDSEYLIAFDLESAAYDVPETAVHLFRGDGYRLIRSPGASLNETIARLPEVQLVFRRPLRFVSHAWEEEVSLQAADPDIKAMVDAVSRGTLQTQVLELQDFGSRHSMLRGGRLASRYIRAQFRAQGYTNVRLHDYNDWNDNVVCVKEGSLHPDEVVVLGAHYDSDSWDIHDAPGADDNATGTAGVMEAARVMANYEFERSVIFIAFSGEEEGLVGSEAWASNAAEAGMDIVGMVNLDMLCYLAAGDREDIDIISNRSSGPLRGLAFDAIRTYVPELAAVRSRLRRGTSDHASFWNNGYRAIFFFEDSDSYSPYIHTPDDIVGLSANNFDFMLKNVKAVIATVATLARPFRSDTQR
jgi:hypothetical protein